MDCHVETDPCSLSYKRQSKLRPISQVSSNKSKARKGFPVTVHKARMGFFRCFKKIFRSSKTKTRASFVMPYEISKPDPTPESPRCTVNHIRASVMSMPVPAVCLTRPSIRRRRTSYRVHSYTGSVSPPSPRHRSLRFSHPVVSDFVVQTARLSAASSNGTTSQNEEHAPRNQSTATDASDQSADLTFDGERKLRPETIWKVTSESVMTWSMFKERLDGHVPKAVSHRVGDRPPSLQCITRLPTIKLPEEIFQSSESETVEKHRSDALKSLEGSLLPQGNERYVLAVMPEDDLPITAVKIHPEQYPSCLLPAGQLAMLPRDHLPDTALTVSTNQHPCCLLPGGQMNAQKSEEVAAPSTWKGKGKYRAYSDVFPEANTILQSRSEIELPQTPNMSRKAFHKRHSEHYKRVESGIFEDDVLPPPLHVRSRMSKEEFNHRHSAHYKRIESCIFDEDVLKSTELPSPIPFTLQPGSSTTFLLPPTPPSHPQRPHHFQAYNAHHNSTPAPALIPARVSATTPILAPQPLRMAPALKIPKIPSPVPMNADRYPFVFKQTGKRFSAEPKYQCRTVDYVEAKFRQQEQRKSKPKMKKGVDEEKLAELRMLDQRIKKVLIY